MTYDPERDSRSPEDMSPNTRPYERRSMGLGIAMILTVLAAFVAVGFWLYATQDTTTLVGDRPAAEQTTGAGTQEPALPNTPTPPTAPSPQRQ